MCDSSMELEESGDDLPWIVPFTDSEIQFMTESEIVADLLPGNYVPTRQKAAEIITEILRALRVKWSVDASGG